MNLQQAAFLKKYEPDADLEEFKEAQAIRESSREPFKYHLLATVTAWAIVALIIIGAWGASH